MALSAKSTVVKKTTKKKVVKAEKPVLITPSAAYDLNQVTEFELFRMTYAKEAYVAMRVGREILRFDKRGDPSKITLAQRMSATSEITFIDYLTEDEGVYLPGSAEERVEPKAAVLTEAEMRAYPPEPSNKRRIQEIPDKVTFIYAGHKVRYEARNYTSTDNGCRWTLSYQEGTDQYSYVPCCDNGSVWTFEGYVDEKDEKRWTTHRMRPGLRIPKDA